MKQAPTEEVMEAIRRVLQGGRYVSGRVQERMLENLSNGSEDGATPGIERLSDRELEVFRLFGSGKTAKEIANQLNLSPKTVSVHRDHVKEKLKFATSAEMIRQAVRYVETEQLGVE